MAETGVIRVTVTARGVPGLANDPLETDLPVGSTVATVLDLALAAKSGPKPDTDPKIFRSLIATVNGQYIPASQVEKRLLVTGDEITIMPLIVGG